MYGVEEMADMLFAGAGPVQLYAAHRLLREDRRLFKQAGRLPPLYQPRPQAEVEALRAQEEELTRVQPRYPYPPPPSASLKFSNAGGYTFHDVNSTFCNSFVPF